MHILSRSFSQRRKSSSHKRPRDLHIRKVSFSGCSLSSGCSFSSTSSTSTTRTHLADMPNGGCHPAGFDPLSLHPTFQPPPRLHERPYLERPAQPVSAFWDDSEDEAELSEVDEIAEMKLPPHTSSVDHGDEREDAQDYFFRQLSTRPNLPRSHWSASTIHTIASIAPDASNTTTTIANPDEEDDDDVSVLEMAAINRRNSNYTFNFSLKRSSSTPQRPPMKPRDSIDNFIKRGGWKRRGIVFHEEDVSERTDRTSYLN